MNGVPRKIHSKQGANVAQVTTIAPRTARSALAPCSLEREWEAAANDIRYRRVILGGVPGKRTVKVPPWNGIDTEGGGGGGIVTP